MTFKIFEWQAVLAARVLAGRAELPPMRNSRDGKQNVSRRRETAPHSMSFTPTSKSTLRLSGLSLDLAKMARDDRCHLTSLNGSMHS